MRVVDQKQENSEPGGKSFRNSCQSRWLLLIRQHMWQKGYFQVLVTSQNNQMLPLSFKIQLHLTNKSSWPSLLCNTSSMNPIMMVFHAGYDPLMFLPFVVHQKDYSSCLKSTISTLSTKSIPSVRFLVLQVPSPNSNYELASTITNSPGELQM